MSSFDAGPGQQRSPRDTHRLWSLWSIMEELKVGEIVKLIHSLVTSASFGTNDAAPIKDEWKQLIRSDLSELLPHCERLGLDVPTQYIKDALFSLSVGPRPNETGMMSRAANLIVRTIEIQLRSRLFFVVRPEDTKLFRETISFGPKEQARFSEATQEMEEAAKCLALGRSTAGAFHAIRCLESGIRALSRCLQIPDPTRASDRNWGAMLKSLKTKIDERWPGSSARLSGDGEFFDYAYAALAAMQNPWRNATMHLDQNYTDEQAKHVFEIVKGFMTKIAYRLDENGQPLA